MFCILTPAFILLKDYPDFRAAIQSWNKQLELIKRDPVLYSTMTIMGIVAVDGKERDMVCLPLEYLNGWLFKVPASRYNK